MPFEIPESWAWCQFGEYLDVRDGTHDSPKYVDKGFPFVTSKNLNNGRIDFSTAKFISEEDHINFSQRSFVEDGDILFAMIGSIGNPVLVVKDREFSIKNVALFKPYNRENTYMDYVLYYLHYIQESLRLDAKGGMQPFIPLNYFRRDLMIPLPPLNEQKRIVSELQKLIAHIDEVDYEATGIKLDINKTKSKILELAISGKLVPQDPNDEPAIELLKRINPGFKPCDNSHYENLPFEIPSTWVWVSHNDMLEISGGAQPPKSEFSEVMKPGYIRLYQIRDYGEKPIPIYIPLSTASKITVKGDILLARYGGSLGKVFIAEDGAYNVAMAKVILCYPEVLNQKFVYYYYLSSIYQNKLRSISRTAQAGFNSGDFEDMYFPLPPLEEQGRIVDAISSIWEMIDMITAEL